MSAKKATRCFTKLCARLLYKFKEIQHGVFMLFFSINEELRSVVNEHFNGKLFSQILDTECVTFINCNKCNCNIRSLILILIRNSMKRQTEKRENKPSGMKKIFRIALAVQGKQNASSTIPLNLTLFCTKFL